MLPSPDSEFLKRRDWVLGVMYPQSPPGVRQIMEAQYMMKQEGQVFLMLMGLPRKGNDLSLFLGPSRLPQSCSGGQELFDQP